LQIFADGELERIFHLTETADCISFAADDVSDLQDQSCAAMIKKTGAENNTLPESFV